MKTFFKEILIIIFLCIAIVLILGIIFYDYIPTNKVVPSTVEAYTTSNTIKEEIGQEIIDYPKQNITLEITDSDLTLYKKDNSYDQGKANPFASSANSTSNQTIDTNVNGSTSEGGNGSSNQFFNNTGLK